MKARRKIRILSLAVIVIMVASANVSFSQDEYDDMYFTPKDRKEVKIQADVSKSNISQKDFENNAVAKNTPQSDVINPSYSPNDYGNLEENYSAKTVNPEYIARYKNNPKGSASDEELAEGDSYYDDYYERTVMPGEKEEESNQGKYTYPSSYYGGHSTAMRTRMYGNPWYDPFYGGYGSGWNLGLGYTFGYMPGFSMSLGYGSGWGYNPYGFYDPFSPFANPYYSMGRFYNPYYSPWAYDPFYSPYSYNPYYSSMYGYGGMGYYYPSPYYGYGGFNSGLVIVGSSGYGSSSSNAIPESNRFESPSYRNRVARGSDQTSVDRKDVPNTSRTVARRNNTVNESQAANARTASNRDFSRSQNEYYNRSGSRNVTTTVATRSGSNRSTVTNIRSTSRSSTGNLNSARVRSSRVSSDYSRPSYKSTRAQRSISSGRSSWSNSGTYRSSRSSSGSSYSTPARSGGSSYSRSSGSSFRSSSSGSSGSYSGGSRSSGSSGGSSRSSRGNR